MFGAAPMPIATKLFYLSLNIYINNAYGMSESSGPQTATDNYSLKDLSDDSLKSAGKPLIGTELIIFNPDKNGVGEICYRGKF